VAQLFPGSARLLGCVAYIEATRDIPQHLVFYPDPHCGAVGSGLDARRLHPCPRIFLMSPHVPTGQKGLVAGDCNAPKVLMVPFRLELVPAAA
jgi:hypothetical protein